MLVCGVDRGQLVQKVALGYRLYYYDDRPPGSRRPDSPRMVWIFSGRHRCLSKIRSHFIPLPGRSRRNARRNRGRRSRSCTLASCLAQQKSRGTLAWIHHHLRRVSHGYDSRVPIIHSVQSSTADSSCDAIDSRLECSPAVLSSYFYNQRELALDCFFSPLVFSASLGFSEPTALASFISGFVFSPLA